MKTILLLVGLPGSGKSTWTNAFLRTERFQLVCRDDIRATYGVDGHNTNGLTEIVEKNVQMVASAMLEAHLMRGLDVVLDETHTSIENVRRIRKIAYQYNYAVHVVFFPMTPDDSKARRPGIPPKAIDRMADNLRVTLPRLMEWADLGMIASFTRHEG